MIGYSAAAKVVARVGPVPWADQLLSHFNTLALFVLLQSLDILTTGYGVGTGIAQEANPLAAQLLNHSLGLMLATKALLVASVAMLVVRLSTRYRHIWAALRISNFFYVFVITINVLSLVWQ